MDDPEPLDAATLGSLRALVDPRRLRILGRLAERPMTRDDLAAALGVAAQTLVRPLERLIAAELVEARPAKGGARFALRGDRLGAIGRRLAALDRGSDRAADALAALEGIPPDDARVLRGFLDEGRLTTIPAHTGKRLVVLRWLRDRVFVEDRDYPEKEVNQRIALVHPDVASLRRYLVDAGLVTRDAGRYRRSPDGSAALASSGGGSSPAP